MRRRLVVALVGVALGTLLLYAGPRAFMITDMVREREELGLERTASLITEAIDLRLAGDLPVDRRQLDSLLTGREDLAIRARLADGTELQAGAAGLRPKQVTSALDDGGTVTVSLSSDAVDERVADALVPIAGFGVAATAFAVAVAFLLARRLATPFTRLAHHAELLGIDDARLAPRAGVPEADELADALDRSQARIAELLRAEREFSSNASHQLRTPLSALRLRIEDVSTWPETSPDVRTELDAALGEVDRLADTVTDLLELARSGGIGGWRELDLHHTATEAAARWRDRFAEAGRRVHVHPDPGAGLASSSDRAVHHVLDVLLENALAHGAGTVDVRIEDRGEHLALRVADEGSFDRTLTERAFERRARSSASTGSGIGLDLARSIAASAGARLTLVSQEPTVLELTVPRHGTVPVRA
jgi:signal transduction histidine kinase